MKTKEDYKKALKTVKKVIDQWDPYRLISGGAPSDEFDPEISAIVSQIPNIKSEQDSTEIISHVFSSQFEKQEFTLDQCSEIGKLLYDELISSGLIES